MDIGWGTKGFLSSTAGFAPGSLWSSPRQPDPTTPTMLKPRGGRKLPDLFTAVSPAPTTAPGSEQALHTGLLIKEVRHVVRTDKVRTRA